MERGGSNERNRVRFVVFIEHDAVKLVEERRENISEILNFRRKKGK